MASLIGLGGTGGVLTTNELLLFDSSVDVISSGVQAGACIYTINNGSGLAFIRNPVINGAGNWFPVPANAKQDFIVARGCGVGQLYGKSDASGTTVSGGPTGAN